MLYRSHYKEMGLEDDFSYDPEEDEYYETKDYEERSAHMAFIDTYDERSFWRLLATRMAQRTLAAERALSPRGFDDEEQLALRIFELSEHFEEEFSKNGLDNVRIDPNTGFH
ncbi:MAG: hypothetical protein WBG92_17070 [Thiohalocapsa sp.]